MSETAESEIEEIFQHTELFECLKFVQALNHIKRFGWSSTECLWGARDNDRFEARRWVGIQDFYGDQDVETNVQKISKEIRKSADKTNILGEVPKRKRGRPRKS